MGRRTKEAQAKWDADIALIAEAIRKDREEERKKLEKKPQFPKKGYFSEKNITSKSRSTIYRIKKREKESEGTMYWYYYPCNIHHILYYCLKRLKNARNR